MPEESIETDPKADEVALKEVVDGDPAADSANDDEEEDEAPEATNPDGQAEASTKTKKKSKKAKLKKALGVNKGKDAEARDPQKPASQFSDSTIQKLLDTNPSLKNEVAGKENALEIVRNMNVEQLMTGMSLDGKNQKDMASYKFWQTQPVPKFDETQQLEEGPIEVVKSDEVKKDPPPMTAGYEWVTMDLTQEAQMSEVHKLLSKHYVEDDEAMFRFNYSLSFLEWALKSPGWRPDWHVGVRASVGSKVLVAFISAVPVTLRVRSATLKTTEVNFLCVHKKLRAKRLAPQLIREITRRCNVHGIYQAIYTGGIVLPKPVSTCRYFHRSLDWQKLYEVGFAHLPSNSSAQRQLAKFKLSTSTSTKGLRPMQHKDVDEVKSLLDRFLGRFDMAPNYDREEIAHWLVHDSKTSPEQVVWSYVVEDPVTHKITDHFSFYCLESTIISSETKHKTIRAAYMFYYASETAFAENEKGYKERLNSLMNDALILAKKFNFDVVNALTLLDNPLFLEEQTFGPGDGQLHYYLFNYRALPIAGGIDGKNNADEKRRGGVGVVML